MVMETGIKTSGHFSTGVAPALGLAVFSALWAGALAMAPRPGEPVAAIFPPWMPADLALALTASLDAREIRGFGYLDTIIIARSDDPAFVGRLRGAGALMVLRASKLTDCMR